MKIWISKNSEVPVREQLIAQITLGIAAGDLGLGEKLPSTREVARRCGVHSNTVGSAYQKLVEQKLLEFKKGSGFYVTESAGDRIEGSRQLERLIEEFFASARALGFDEAEVMARIKHPTSVKPSNRLVVIDSDEGLREILVHELSSRFPDVSGASFEDLSEGLVPDGGALVAMLDEKSKIEPILRPEQSCVYLKGRSVSTAMAGNSRPAPDEIVAVVSGWQEFLSFARIMLLAAKVDPGCLVVRSTADDGWREAIKGASIIICDSLTYSGLTEYADRVRQFQIISDQSLGELDQFLGRS